MSAPFNDLQSTVVFLRSRSLFEDEGADLMEFYVEFHTGAQLDRNNKIHPMKNPSHRLIQTYSGVYVTQYFDAQYFDVIHICVLVSKNWKFVSLYCHQHVESKPHNDTWISALTLFFSLEWKDIRETSAVSSLRIALRKERKKKEQRYPKTESSEKDRGRKRGNRKKNWR